MRSMHFGGRWNIEVTRRMQVWGVRKDFWSGNLLVANWANYFWFRGIFRGSDCCGTSRTNGHLPLRVSRVNHGIA
jgi:hypothetical protein